MRRSDRNFTKIPDGKLGIIALEGCKELGKTIDNYIIQWRSETYKDFKDSVACDGYLRDTYLLDASCPRFGSGEAKGIIRESVRDMDLYIIVDVLNYSVTYSLSGRVNHMSPDDHYAALLRGVQRDEIERGQVLCQPGSITCHTKFTAQVYVLTKDEGGRHTPFFNNYRPQFYFRTTDVTGVCDLPEGTEMCMPGDNIEMTIELIHPIAMSQGLTFAIREGGRTVGSGRVATIIE